MSHTKLSFVLEMLLKVSPRLERLDDCLAYAETVFDRSMERAKQRGYGPRGATGPRESVDWYAKLVEPSKSWFDQLWTAYGLKRDRNGAAMRWYQLGDLTEIEARRIIDAAKHDNRQWRETATAGQVRKMAQGWLFEKRWMDYAPSSESRGNAEIRAGDAQLREMKQQLATLRRLNDAAPNSELLRQIDELTQKIGNFNRDPHA